jgi:hypothetical protein
MRQQILAIIALSCLSSCHAFVSPRPASRTRPLFSSIIDADELDFDFDVGQGGVRLAEESVLVLAGTVQHKPGSATSKPTDFMRYKKLTPVSEQTVQALYKEIGATIISTGRGKENYRDPGETTVKDVVKGPHDAVRDSLNGAGSAMEASKVVLNFSGGDDTQVQEILDAAQEIVIMLDVATKAKIAFNSITHKTFEMGHVSLCIVGMPADVSLGGRQGVERALASGKLYFDKGQWYTLVDEDIDDAVA